MRKIVTASILLFALFWLAPMWEGVARADELPPAACGARVRLNWLGPPILQELQDSGLVGDHGPVTVAISGISFTPFLGQLTYDADGRPRKCAAGLCTNDPDSSDDDYVRARIALSISAGGIHIITYHINVLFGFPTNPPQGIIDNGGRECLCRTLRAETVELVHAFPWCNAPGIPSGIDNCANVSAFIGSYDPPGLPCNIPSQDVDCPGGSCINGECESWVYAGKHPMGHTPLQFTYPFDWFNHVASQLPVPEGTSISRPLVGSEQVDLLEGCTEHRVVRCGVFSQHDKYYNEWGSPPENGVCHVCVRKYYAEEFVRLEQDDFPGPVAVDFSFEGDPSKLCDTVQAINAAAGAALFLNSILSLVAPYVGVPLLIGNSFLVARLRQVNCDIDLNVMLAEAGFGEYDDHHPLWWDLSYDPSQPVRGEIGYDFRSPYQVSVENTCCLQNTLSTQMGQLFSTTVDVPGYGAIPVRDVIRVAGGVRISEHKNSLYMMVPPTWTNNTTDMQPVSPGLPPACTDGVPWTTVAPLIDIFQPYGAQVQALVSGQRLDFPTVINAVLANDETAQAYGASVTCNHGRDCSVYGAVDTNGDGVCDCDERGLIDTDGDGFCDHDGSYNTEDKCRYTVQGANCDVDGDGVGDAPPQMHTNCISNHPDVQLGGEQKQQLYHQLCGGCDNCPDAPNHQVHRLAYSGSPHGQQWDRDRDGIGDACDEDVDDDGVQDDFDCDPRNPGIAHDRDGDGRCDPITDDPTSEPYATLACLHACWENEEWYYNYDYPACLDTCLQKDNCANLASTFCYTIDTCTTMSAIINPNTCDPARCDFVPGPEWPASFVGNRCIPRQTKYCAEVFGNADQVDSDGQLNPDGLTSGDKCDSTPRASDVFFGRGHLMSPLWCSPTIVGFRATGGSVTSDPAQVDADGFRIPQYTPVSRDGVSVGACKCPLTLVDGEWDQICSDPQRCPTRIEYVSSGPPGQLRRTWNPINAPTVVGGAATPNPIYPTAPAMATAEPAIVQHVDDKGLIYGREMEFGHAPGSRYYHAFDWHTADSVTFTPGDYGPWSAWTDPSYAIPDWSDPAEVAKLKVRVAWPGYVYSLSNPVPQHEVVLSQAGPTSGDCGLAGALAGRDFVRTVQPLGDPDAILPRETVIVVIPGVWQESLATKLRGPTMSRPGYFIGQDEASGRMHLYALGSDVPKVVAIWRLEASDLSETRGALVSASGAFDSALVGLDSGRQPSVFIYKSPVEADDSSAPGEAAKLLVGVETAGGPLALESIETLFGTPSPDVHQAHIVYTSRSQQVLLIGTRLPGGQGPLEVWRFDFAQGAWSGPTRLAIAQRRTGFSATYDPLLDRVLVFGGGLSVGGDTAEVVTVDPATLFVRRFATVPTDASLGLARSHSGTFLDPVARALYVYGGRRLDEVVTDKDVWKLDLTTRRWSRMIEASFDDAPDPVVAPFLYYNRRTGTTFVADLLGRSTADGLSLWALDKDGYWHATETFRRPGSETWPVQGAYSPGSMPNHTWATPDDLDWPGQLLLARLQSDQARLGLSVIAQSGDVLARSDVAASGDQEAAFICPVGQKCYLQVAPLPLGGATQWDRYTLDVQPAEPILEHQEVLVPGAVRDLALQDDVVYVAGMAGLRALQADGTLDPLSSLGGWQAAGITGLAVCGRYLCASRVGMRGLKVIDIADPTAIRAAGSVFTAGLGWDVTAVGTTAYVAHGFLGVGRYDVSDSSNPTWEAQLYTGGRIITVAAQGGVLAAGRKSGRVHLWDVSGSPQSVGEVQAKGKISRARFVAGQLWLLGKNGSWVEVFDVRDPAAPVKLGELTANASQIFHGRMSGNRAFTFHGHIAQVYEIRPLP